MWVSWWDAPWKLYGKMLNFHQANTTRARSVSKTRPTWLQIGQCTREDGRIEKSRNEVHAHWIGWQGDARTSSVRLCAEFTTMHRLNTCQRHVCWQASRRNSREMLHGWNLNQSLLEVVDVVYIYCPCKRFDADITQVWRSQSSWWGHHNTQHVWRIAFSFLKFLDNLQEASKCSYEG